MEQGQPYVNVGFWSNRGDRARPRGRRRDRAIEDEVGRQGGHKSLYSDAYYDELTFDRLYGGAEYRPSEEAVRPPGRLPTLYDKAVRRR
jgi:hypothetical protein